MLIGCPCDVVPVHCPLKLVDGDGEVGPSLPPQPLATM
jgi:hypothetical protein